MSRLPTKIPARHPSERIRHVVNSLIDAIEENDASRDLQISELGQSVTNIDNSVADLTTTVIGDKSPLTTKGDLYVFDTANARLPIGSDDQVLIADSSTSLGVKWGDAASSIVWGVVTSGSGNSYTISVYSYRGGSLISTGGTCSVPDITDDLASGDSFPVQLLSDGSYVCVQQLGALG